MWDLIVSVPDHCLSFYFVFTSILEDFKNVSNFPKYSKFIYPAAGHIITGNLKIISDPRIRYIVSKGPKYRFPSRIDLKTM